MDNKEALIVINMLNDFVLEGAPLEVPSTRTIIPELRREIEKAREENIPVIYVCDSHDRDDREFSKMGWPPHAVKGTNGAEVVKELKPLKGDRIIEKRTYTASDAVLRGDVYFERTLRILKAKGIDKRVKAEFFAKLKRKRNANVLEDTKNFCYHL